VDTQWHTPFSGGDFHDPTIREWDPLTWQQVGHHWEGHTSYVNAITIHPAGTLVASVSDDKLTTMSVSGGSQIGGSLPSSSIHPRRNLSLSPWVASTSSAEAKIIRPQSGKYPVQRQVSTFDSQRNLSILRADPGPSYYDSPQCMYKWAPVYR